MNRERQKERIFDIISKDDGDNKASRIFDLLIMGLILLSIATIVLESFDTLHSQYHSLF